MPDHAHMLPVIPPKHGASSVMGCLKGKSSLMIFDKRDNPKHKFGDRRFWAEGRCVSTVGLNEATIAKYIRGAGGRRHRAGQAERQGVLRPVQEIARAGRFHRRATGQGQ